MRGQIQGLIQELLEEEITELLGRAKSARRSTLDGAQQVHPFLDHYCPPFSSFLLCPLRMTRWSLFLQTLSLLHHFLGLYSRFAQGHIQGFSHLGRWPTVVALEENPGPGGDSGRAFPNPNQTLEFFPLFRRQPHCVLVPDHHCHPRQQHFPPGRIA